MKIIYNFETEEEMMDWLDRKKESEAALSALTQLKSQLRSKVKYGEPTLEEERIYRELCELTEFI